MLACVGARLDDLLLDKEVSFTEEDSSADDSSLDDVFQSSETETDAEFTDVVAADAYSVPDANDSGLEDVGVQQDASLCHATSGNVVGHCITNQATVCVDYGYEYASECTRQPQSGANWLSGACGSDQFSDLLRSNGGCKDDCGLIVWTYPLGGIQPTESTRSTQKSLCEALGRTYVEPPPFLEVDAGLDSGIDAGSDAESDADAEAQGAIQ